MSTIKTGWLKDKNGDKFAPKTLSSQVIGSDGVNLEDKIQAQLDEFRNEMGEKDHNHDDLYETKEDANNKLAEGKLYTDTLISDKADKEHTHDLYETKEDAQLKYDELTAIKAEKNHSHSWNDLTDKPFYEDSEVLLEWDGDRTGLDMSEGSDWNEYRIGNNISYEDMVGATIYLSDSTSIKVKSEDLNIYDSAWQAYFSTSGGYISIANIPEDFSTQYSKPGLYHSDMSDTLYVTKIVKENIKQIDEKFIPHTIARTQYVDENFALKSDLQNIDLSALETKEDAQLKYDTITAAKANWNQNDENAIDYIRNRPFYETDPILTSFIPETTLSEYENEEEDMFYMCIYNFDKVIQIGELYNVTFDGILYENLMYDYNTQSLGATYNDLYNNTSSYPFALSFDEFTNCYWIYNKGNASHTIKVEGMSIVTHKIDKKFLPTLVGENVSGKIYTIDETEATASEGAEVFNDYKHNIASGHNSHAEGYNTMASGVSSHAEGNATTASGNYGSHAEGNMTTASGDRSHAEGTSTTASGNQSHAEGQNTTASGSCSHTEGMNTTASGSNSHAEGHGTIATRYNSHVQGSFNIEDTSKTYIHIVGNGRSESNRSNAHTLDFDGNAWFAGNIRVGGTEYDNGSEVALKSDLANIDLSKYETKTDSQSKLDEAKAYADSAASTVKNDLLNGAGEAYDTLKELGELIDENQDAIEALETVATNKADKEHNHTVSEITDYTEPVNGDWNQNDETDADFIKNRTHYNSLQRDNVFALSTLDGIQQGIDDPSIYTTIFSMNDQESGGRYVLEVGEVYEVIFDGVTYSNLTCFLFDYYYSDIDTTAKYPAIGATDTDSLKSNNDYPFTIVCNTDYKINLLSTTKSDDTHTLEIHKLTENIKQLDEKYIPDTIARVEDIPTKTSELDNDSGYLTEQIQTDWNVNDETSPAYIKNRPFYTTDPVSTVIVEETAITLQDGMGQLTSTHPLEVGREYSITLDGTTYNCVAKIYEGDMSYVGNGGLVGAGEDTGEPFIIATKGFETAIKINSDVLEHTVGIVGMISEIHKLDEKYIPDSLKESINKRVGLKVEGKTFNIYNPESGNYEAVVADYEAEIFNDYENNKATGRCSHAEGSRTIASGWHSHAEGRDTGASGNSSHAEGWGTEASGQDSHAEGGGTKASGMYSHAEGQGTKASGDYSHAEGNGTTASGQKSHAEGHYTKASGEYQHAQGTFNIEDTESKYAHIVGNGTSGTKRSNAHTLDWNGNAWYQGDVYVGGTSGTNKDEGSKKLATEEYVDNVMASGSDVFVVNFELTDNEDYTGYNVTTSTTFDEVYDAIQNGKTVIGHATFRRLTCVLHAEEIESSSVCFVCINETLRYERITKLTIEMSAYYDAVCSIHNLVAYDDNNSIEATAIILKSPNRTRFKITVGDDGVLTSTAITE